MGQTHPDGSTRVSSGRLFGSVRRLTGRNPLLRRSDRLEALVVLLVAFIAIAALPTIVHYAKGARDERAREITAQAQSVHSVQATATADSTVPIVDDMSPVETTVPAQWTTQGFLNHTDTVKVDHFVRAGDRFTLWLDADEHPSAPPRDPSSALGEVVLAGFAVYCTIVALAGFLLLLVIETLNYFRRRTWDSHIRILVDNGGNWVDKKA